MSTTNGNTDTSASSGSSTVTGTVPAEKPSRSKKHTLRLPGMPPIGITSSAPLIDTPYAFSHAAPFEYPFPSPSTSSTPGQQAPVYIPTLDIPAQSPFPFAPALISRGSGPPFGNGGVNSLGLGFPVWKRSASPPHPKLVPSRADPPVPPGLRDKVKDKVQGITRAVGGEQSGKDGKTTSAGRDDGTSWDDRSDESGTNPDRGEARETEAETSRSPTPGVT